MKYICPKCFVEKEHPFNHADALNCPICNSRMKMVPQIKHKRKYKPLDNIMMDIVEYGEGEIWKDIEAISNPIERAKKKGLFYFAIKRLKQKFKGEK